MTLEDSQVSVVFVGTMKSVFVTRTAEALRDAGMVVRIVDPYGGTSGSLLAKAGPIGRVINRILTTRRILRDVEPHDAAVMHYLNADAIWMAPLLRKRFPRTIGVAYGSDILRRNVSRDWLLRYGLRAFDCLAATNVNVMDALVTACPEIASKDCRIIRFGLPVLEELDRLRLAGETSRQAKINLGFDTERKLVALGYGASSGQRQKELIKYFAARPSLSKGIQFVVPVQYGNSDVTADVISRCEKINVERGREDFVALTTFFNPEKSAWFRMASDVLINHSVSDAFSGTVQEVVHAGNRVLAVDHLPYAQMPGAGISIQMYSDLEECESHLSVATDGPSATPSPEVLSQIRAALHRTSGWAGVLSDWRALIRGEPATFRNLNC